MAIAKLNQGKGADALPLPLIGTTVTDGQTTENGYVAPSIIGHEGSDGVWRAVGPDNPQPSADYSPPESCLACDGIDVPPGGVVTIPAVPGRIKIDLVRLDSVDSGSSPVLVGAGAHEPAAGKGGALWPRGGVSFYTDDPIKLFYAGPGTARVGFLEWAAG